uniref:Uncharacterized protein n=1 Tax=Mycena chlorophos TaxID=658473 RepID=A0ABQ0M8W3_MYCCL|nr:predicted protein [Mycena chlorophos]
MRNSIQTTLCLWPTQFFALLSRLRGHVFRARSSAPTCHLNVLYTHPASFTLVFLATFLITTIASDARCSSPWARCWMSGACASPRRIRLEPSVPARFESPVLDTWMLAWNSRGDGMPGPLPPTQLAPPHVSACQERRRFGLAPTAAHNPLTIRYACGRPGPAVDCVLRFAEGVSLGEPGDDGGNSFSEFLRRRTKRVSRLVFSTCVAASALARRDRCVAGSMSGRVCRWDYGGWVCLSALRGSRLFGEAKLDSDYSLSAASIFCSFGLVRETCFRFDSVREGEVLCTDY